MKCRNKLLAELIGITLGDGSIMVYKNYQAFKITLNSKELNYLEYIDNLLKSLFKTNPIIKFRKGENTVDLFIFKREIIHFLTDKIGLVKSPKWDRAKIPEKYLKNNLDLYILKGLFDTDGCLAVTNNNGTIYPRLEIKISPSPMQQQFITIFNKYHFKFGVYNIGNGKIRIQLNGKEQLRKWLTLVGFSNEKHLIKSKQFL